MDKNIILKGVLGGGNNLTKVYGSSNSKSLIDGDIVIFGNACVGRNYKIEHREITDLLANGKNIFFFLYNNNMNGAVGSWHYDFYADRDKTKPGRRDILKYVGKEAIFKNYADKYLKDSYIEFEAGSTITKDNKNVLFVDKNQDPVGWYSKVSDSGGHLIHLPPVNFENLLRNKTIDQRKKVEDDLIASLIEIDDYLRDAKNLIKSPDWVSDKKFAFSDEIQGKEEIRWL